MEIAIISGKGGTGKSSISAAFATMDGEVVVADCDVDAANLYLIFNPSHDEEEIYTGGQKAFINHDICTNCGYCIDYCRFDAITFGHGRVEISEISCDGCGLCSRICPLSAVAMVTSSKSRLYSGSFRNGKMVYGRLAPGEENSGKLVNRAREKAKRLSEENSLERIIIDGPPGIGCPVISTITGVSKVIVVTEPTLSGMHDMKRAIEIVQKFGLKPSVIVNKYDLNPEMTALITEWCSNGSVEVAGILPFDPELVEAMMMGKSISEYNPLNRISKELKSIWNKILIEK